MPFDKQLELVLKEYKASGTIPSDVAVQQCRRFIRVWVTNDEARKRYRYRPFPGRVTLFASSLSGETPKVTRWRELALGGLDVYQFQVSHDDLVHEPNARLLAEALEQCMEESRAGEMEPPPVSRTQVSMPV